MRVNDLTKKKTMTTQRQRQRQRQWQRQIHLESTWKEWSQRLVTFETSDKKTNTFQEHPQRAILVTCDIWDTVYIPDNWEPDFMTIFVSWQLRVTFAILVMFLCCFLNFCLFDVFLCYLFRFFPVVFTPADLWYHVWFLRYRHVTVFVTCSRRNWVF